jgi:GMP synthase (glutamine-hydrolysing)
MILLINISKFSLTENEFVKPVQKIVESCEKKTIIKHINNLTSNDLKNINKIIICGNSLKDNDFLNYDVQWLKNFKKPVLGICAGMQLIAKIFDNELYKQTEIGMCNVKFLNGTMIEAFELHNFAVKPNGFKILARSENCSQIIKRGNFIGVMFHPEVRNEWLIKDFINEKTI